MKVEDFRNKTNELIKQSAEEMTEIVSRLIESGNLDLENYDDLSSA